jgi:D-3-phosphoglycerate dehydrogenase / 2-oxoglutarate reductase
VLPDYLALFAGRQAEVVAPSVRERLSEQELLPLVGDIDGALCGDDAFTERVLCAAPRLKVISKWGTGIDSIDCEAAARLGIAVRNSRDVFTQAVADTVMGYILLFARSLYALHAHMRQGLWQKLPSRALHECTLGVVGVGCCGKAVVRRARAFGMRVLGHDIAEIAPAFLEESGMIAAGKEQLLSEADFLSMNCDLNPTSRHWLGAGELGRMKAGAVVRNTARGAVIDEPALTAALEAGRLGGAGLDVFEEEPLPRHSPLRSMPHVFLSPHNANSSPSAWRRVHENTLKNLFDVLESV